MGLVLEANYSKKLGLPGYSSHQYSITVRTELADITKVDEESKRLYSLLQGCVDRELGHPGFVPGAEQHHPNSQDNENGQSASRQVLRPQFGGNSSSAWKCSPKQKELILKIIDERQLSLREVEDLAGEMFGLRLQQLNKLQASALIDELTGRVRQSTTQGRSLQGTSKSYAQGGGRA